MVGFRFWCSSPRERNTLPKHPGTKTHGVISMVLPRAWVIQPSFRVFLRSLFRTMLLTLIAFTLLLWLGAEYQDFRARQEPATTDLYETRSNCQMDPVNCRTQTILSDGNTSSILDDHSNSLFVAHCGECGKCSTPHDIRLYDETHHTLFATTVNCAKRSFLWGRKTASQCMEDHVGFTEGCNNCWVENIMCSVKSCLFVCTWQSLFHRVVESNGTPQSSSNQQEHQQDMNRCTRCDEQRCGRKFVTCAGANRRRSGITSDIERDGQLEVCHRVTNGHWWRNETLQQTWAENNSQEPATPNQTSKLLRG